MDKKTTARVNIVIVCWNALEYSKQTIESLFNTVKTPYFLTIVDNSSTDGSDIFLKDLITPATCKKYTFIKNKKNIGYGGAINQGYKISKKFGLEFTCICNNDLFFQNSWMKKMITAMDNDKRIGILGTLKPAFEVKHHTKNISTKKVIDLTPRGYTKEKELSFFCAGRSFEEAAKKIIKANGGGIEHLKAMPNAVVTCCALVRNSVIELNGYLADSRFKIFGSEDIDLSWSIGKLGYKCTILKNVYVHHFRHKSITISNLNRSKYLS